MAKFVALKSYQRVYLLDATIGSHIITNDEIKEVKRVLALEDLDANGLRAMRNTVVRFLANAKDEYYDEFENTFIDFDRYMQLRSNMSGITGVIDHMLWSMGCEV